MQKDEVKSNNLRVEILQVNKSSSFSKTHRETLLFN